MGIGLFIEPETGYVADIEIGSNGIETDDGLETACLISIFTDQRATDEDLPEPDMPKRGWWGDMFAEKEGDQIGSKLWLYEREKQTLENLSKIEDTCKNSLQWFVEDGIAKSVEVSASYPQAGFTLIEIKITKPDGEVYAFKTLWDGQRLKRA